MAFFSKGLEGFAGTGSLGRISWDDNKINVYLIDVNDAGPSAGAYVISGVTNAGATVTVTTSAAHGLSVGDRVEVFSVGGITNVNGDGWVVATVPTSTTFTYTATTTPTGTYTSGGFIMDLSLTYLSELVASSGYVKATMAASGKSITNGVLDGQDISFIAVSGDPVEAWVATRAANAQGDADLADNAQRLILAQTTATAGLTGLPATPNGGNINITFSSQGIGRL